MGNVCACAESDEVIKPATMADQEIAIKAQIMAKQNEKKPDIYTLQQRNLSHVKVEHESSSDNEDGESGAAVMNFRNQTREPTVLAASSGESDLLVLNSGNLRLQQKKLQLKQLIEVQGSVQRAFRLKAPVNDHQSFDPSTAVVNFTPKVTRSRQQIRFDMLISQDKKLRDPAQSYGS